MEDLNDKMTSDTLSALEWNQMPSELQNVIEKTGQTLSGADLDQVGKGVANYVAVSDFYVDSGVADAYVLTAIGSYQAPTAYTDGMRVRFVPANAGVGGTATVNVNALGVRNIVTEFGNAFEAGKEFNTFTMVELRYNLAAAEFKLVKPRDAGVGASAFGLNRIANQTEVNAGVDAQAAVASNTLAARLDLLGSDDIDNDSTVTGTTVSDALETLEAAIGENKLVIKQANEQITNDATLSDDSELTIPSVAPGLWKFEASIQVVSNVTPDFKFRMSNIVTTSSASGYSIVIMDGNQVDGVSPDYKTSIDQISMDNVINFTNNDGWFLSIKGRLEVNVLGTVAFQWAQNVSDASPTTVRAGSWIELSRG